MCVPESRDHAARRSCFWLWCCSAAAVPKYPAGHFRWDECLKLYYLLFTVVWATPWRKLKWFGLILWPQTKVYRHLTFCILISSNLVSDRTFGLRLKFETCLSEVLVRSRSTVRSVRLQDRSGAGILQVSCIASMMMMNKVAQCANVLRYVTSIFSSQLGWVLVNDNRCMQCTGWNWRYC